MPHVVHVHDIHHVIPDIHVIPGLPQVLRYDHTDAEEIHDRKQRIRHVALLSLVRQMERKRCSSPNISPAIAVRSYPHFSTLVESYQEFHSHIRRQHPSYGDDAILTVLESISVLLGMLSAEFPVRSIRSDQHSSDET